MLHVVFRHGEKIPHKEFQNYPNDPHKNYSYYPIGNGGLTNDGKMREYEIGKMLRDRYDDFFGRYYSSDEIYARSSCVPRTQMSLQLVLTGLFPPVDKQIWNKNLFWQPTLTFCEPRDTDYLFFPENCFLLQNELKKFFAQDDIQELFNRYKSIFDYLTKYSGKNIQTFEDVTHLYNTLKEQKMCNLELPKWTSKVYPYPMKNLSTLNFQLISGSTILKRLGGGIILRKITNDMIDLYNKTLYPPERKAFLLSGHEFNVIRLARTIGIKKPVFPDYGSTIIIETLKDDDDDVGNALEKIDSYFVRILHWPGSKREEIRTEKIPGCNEICPLKEFLNLLKNVIPDKYESECEIKKKEEEEEDHENLMRNGGGKNLSLNNIIFIIIIIICFFYFYI